MSTLSIFSLLLMLNNNEAIITVSLSGRQKYKNLENLTYINIESLCKKPKGIIQLFCNTFLDP